MNESWRVRVPGQPISVNHLYKEATRPKIDRFGQVVYGPSGKPEVVRAKVKADGVQTYQDSVTWYTKQARPSGWVAGSRVRLRYWFYLDRDIDGDNALKALNDAIAHALGCDDKAFLPCVVEKTTGSKDPHVVVEIENEKERHVHESGDRRVEGTASQLQRGVHADGSPHLLG